MRRALLASIILLSSLIGAQAQTCNDPAGFIKSRGTFALGDAVIFGPDCETIQSGGGGSAVPANAIPVGTGGFFNSISGTSALLFWNGAGVPTASAVIPFNVGIQGGSTLIPLDVGGAVHAQKLTISNGVVTSGQQLSAIFIPGVTGISLGNWNVGQGNGSPFSYGADNGGQAIFLDQYVASSYVANSQVSWGGISVHSRLSSGLNGSISAGIFNSYLDNTWSNTIDQGGQVALFATATNLVGGGDNFGFNNTVTINAGLPATRTVTANEVDIDNRSNTFAKYGIVVNDDGTSVGNVLGALALTNFLTSSVSTVSYGTGAKNWVVAAGQTYLQPAQLVRINCTTGGNITDNYMVGNVTSYSGTALAVNITAVGLNAAAGSCSAWTVSNAVSNNAAFWTQSISGGTGFQYGFAAIGQGGNNPVATTGTAFYVGGGNIARGLDMTAAAFSGPAISTPGADFNHPGFIVDNIGDLNIHSVLDASAFGGGAFVVDGGGSVAKTFYVGANLNIGTVGVPDSKFTINSNTAATVAPPAGTSLHIVTTDNQPNVSVLDTFSSAGQYSARRADGTLAAKQAVAANANVRSDFAYTWDTATYNAVTGIQFVSGELQSASAHGAYLKFLTTPLTTTGIAEALRIQASGGFSVGAAAIAADPGTGSANFANGISVGTTQVPVAGQIFINNATFLIRTKTAFTNNGAATSPTLGAAGPVGATTPTKWIGIDDNGTTRFIPAW